ncbi:MAG: 4Fe-4S dicluster domain-containing protein [Bacteroidales bacterium]|nr:4Fe-4S dicluster domain-containing protein [Bacteroidales bacterium]
MLKKSRIALAAIFFIAISLLFLGISGELTKWFGWMPKFQFLPAVLAVNVGVIVLLVLVALLFGRCYCSIVCPMGVYQDIVSWLSGKRKGKKMRFSYKKEIKWLRYGIWVLFVVALIAGIQVFVALLAPYSAYGRMLRTLVAPASTGTIIIAIVTFLVVTILAWIGGRTYCNTVCPVGTTLSFFSRFAMFRPIIDADKCKGCRACEKQCKASCIDIANKKIDYSRCVDCFNCVENCKFGALTYGKAWGKAAKCHSEQSEESRSFGKPQDDINKPQDDINKSQDDINKVQDDINEGRRAFIASSAIAVTAATLGAQEKKLDGGLAEIIDKQAPERTAPLTPFGSDSIKDFYRHCTACQLCVANCPNHVLRPSTDLEHFMQPVMSYENGYCRPECTKCSQVCPAGAIKPITPQEKTQFHIGTATVDRSLCVVERDGVTCGNCARHCPVGAIMMVRKDPQDRRSPMIPSVDEAKCIGCGACENLCPSRPFSAIHVNGLQVHIKD